MIVKESMTKHTEQIHMKAGAVCLICHIWLQPVLNIYFKEEVERLLFIMEEFIGEQIEVGR